MFYLQQFYQHLLIFYSSQEEEVDYSTNDVDEASDNNDMQKSTPNWEKNMLANFAISFAVMVLIL